MPSWLYYFCIFFLGAGSNRIMAYYCNMKLSISASFVLGILLGLALAVGYIRGKFED